jgi:hypothetical protein
VTSNQEGGQLPIKADVAGGTTRDRNKRDRWRSRRHVTKQNLRAVHVNQELNNWRRENGKELSSATMDPGNAEAPSPDNPTLR